MTKNEKTQEEKKLVWKMKELPSADSIGNLVDTKVITPEEARAILFKEETKQSDEVEALKEMVKTLQEVVKDLQERARNVQLVPYTKIVEIPVRRTPYWDKYWFDGSGINMMSATTVSSNSGKTAYSLSIK